MGSVAQGAKKRIEILNAGLELWRAHGEAAVTARAVGQRVGISHAGVLHHCKSASGLRQAVATWAVEQQDRTVVPQLIVGRHPAADLLTPEQRAQYLASL